MKRAACYLLAIAAAPFVVLFVAIAVGFGVAFEWLMGDDA